MKTTILKNISFAAIVALSLSGCKSDFLDLVNPNQAVEETFWTSEANAQAALATVYSPIRGQMYGYFGGYTGWHTMNRADDVWFILGEEILNWEPATYTNTANTAESDFGRLYNCINRANVVLKNIRNVPMSENKINELYAEASFLRGYAYFLLASNFGDVPIRLLPAGESSDEIMKKSSPEEEVWKQVAEDFKTAKEYLPVTRPAAEAGRVTKGAAIAYLGKTYLFMKRYPEAEAELATIMKAPYNYDLVENFEDNFTEYKELNKESIFELIYDGSFGSGSWGSEESTSTQGFVIANFVGPQGTGGWFKWMPTASIVKSFTAEERPAGSNSRFDKRMYTSLFWKHSDFESTVPDGAWFGNMSFDKIWEACATKRLRGEPDFPTINAVKGRFLIKKFTNFYKNEADANSMYNQQNQNNNLRVMRYAEVLLMHAEACIKTGKLGDAAADLTRIRNRAGLASKTWANADELWKEMIHQNELEFFFEGHRFFDLKRWYSYDQMKQILVTNKKQGAENFQARHYYLPIPQGEMNTNTAIQQHPLWR
ncbi:SusD family protein [Sphingobacterium spiritivorum ATCC 33300]|uniref:SusD family protein n=1 Tax=Sphingobacterium spiritivorum ATCC 33300 TaxID=525372 RepID=C2G193_SPHSI|nr:RagB/SusD family nutrient uptake outer membrane protein [Sphingobacterium spiritivorum]EEI91070.1 SusD family protein [Sphingobacterium spiritivorum ATCC 33300]QQS97700.1 RagB/SusD family nutrient uptake outer membrane protein [Sphingobacterium spiritivorum]